MRRLFVGLAAASWIAGWQLATQLAAERLDPSSLGEAWWSGQHLAVYPFWSWLLWTSAFEQLPATLHSVEWWGYGSAAGAVALAMVGRVLGGSAKATSTAYGSARWAELEEVREAGLGESGVVLCQSADAEFRTRWQGRKRLWTLIKEGRLICDDGDTHCVVYASTRSGKGLSIVVPSLLSWLGSAIIYDIKRELWWLTAGWRSLFSRCLRFEPTASHSVKYNPVFEVPRGDGDVAGAMNIATTLCGTHAEERKEGEHWKLTATDLITGAILHVLYAGELKSLAGVRMLLASEGRSQRQILETMLRTLHLGNKAHPQIAAYATAGLNMSDNERSGVFSTAISHLGIFLDPTIAANTNSSDFRVADINAGDCPVSLYLVVPPNNIDRLKPLFRLVMNQIGQGLTGEMEAQKPTARATGWKGFWARFQHACRPQSEAAKKHRVLYMLDEFTSIGCLPFIASSMPYLASYGIKLCIVVQTPAQLWKTYGRYNDILDNAHVQVAFGVNSLETAKMLSELLGQRTEVQVRKSKTKKIGGWWYDSENVSETEHGRPLMTAAELRTMHPDELVLLVGGLAPYRAKKVRFHIDGRFRDRASLPAPHSPDAQAREIPPDSGDCPWHTPPIHAGAMPQPAAPQPQQGELEGFDVMSLEAYADDASTDELGEGGGDEDDGFGESDEFYSEAEEERVA